MIGARLMHMKAPNNASLSARRWNSSPYPSNATTSRPKRWSLISRVGTASALLTLGVAASPEQLYVHGDPTNEEQYLLELVNRARLDPAGEAARYGIDLNEGVTGKVISADPKQPLVLHSELIDAARVHSQWMLDTDSFSHTGSNGTNPGDRMRNAGYTFSGSWTYGENIAWQGTTGNLDLTAVTFELHQGLFVDEGIAGRGHRVNLMNPNFREVGIGTLTGLFAASGRDYNSAMIVEDFAASDAYPSAFLVGVVYEDRDGDGFYSPGEGLSGVTVQPSAGTYYAVTSGSGGFAIPIKGLTGELTVSIDTLSGTIAKRVALTGQNVKLDFDTTKDKPATSEIRLGLPRISAGGAVTLHVTANPGQTVELQASTDLRNWSTLQTVTLVSTGIEVVDTPTSGASPRFYRVVGR